MNIEPNLQEHKPRGIIWKLKLTCFWVDLEQVGTRETGDGLDRVDQPLVLVEIRGSQPNNFAFRLDRFSEVHHED